MEKKRLVVCLDGTWNHPGKESELSERDKVYKPTNVLKTARAVLPVTPDNGLEQITYYDIGVGALRPYPGTANKVHQKIDQWFGGTRGAGFEGNIEDAYRFLCQNYHEGDEIYIFGFSRGASAARSLTLFIAWMKGLLRKIDSYWLPRFFDAYLESDEGATFERTWNAALEDVERLQEYKFPDLEPAKRHKRAERIMGFDDGVLKMVTPVRVRYLGVWDTVLSLGSKKEALHVGNTPASVVEHARHAIALDEKRPDFLPKIWQGSSPDNLGQTVEQRWFPGVHSNVGGGYVNDGLANLALHWILEGSKNAGLEFNDRYLSFYKPYSYDTMYKSRKTRWKVWEYVTLRGKKGVRKVFINLGKESPPLANFDIDISVFRRLVGSSEETSERGSLKHPELELYRPKNLLVYLSTIPDLDELLTEKLPGSDNDELRNSVRKIVKEFKESM